jgi:Zn-dependent protease with chaperone function
MIRPCLRVSAALALLSLTIVAAGPAAVAGVGVLAREVGEICRVGVLAEAGASASVRGPLAFVPLALIAAGLVLAIADRMRQQMRLRSFLAAHRTRALRHDDPIFHPARRLGLAGRVRVIEGPGLPAFVAGTVRPRIFLSDSLFTALSTAELEATFRHEVEHLRRRDPVRLALIRFAERSLFWMPAARALAARAAAALEARADDAPAALGRLELASAIVKTARMARPAPRALPALHQTPATWRVRRLIDDAPAPPPGPSTRLPASLILLAALWAGALLGRPIGDRTTAPCNTCVLREQIARPAAGASGDASHETPVRFASPHRRAPQ